MDWRLDDVVRRVYIYLLCAAATKRQHILLSGGTLSGMEAQNQYADTLRSYMERHGLNQSDLAEKLGTDRHQVSRWLTGGKIPSLDTRKNMAEKLGLAITRLL